MGANGSAGGQHEASLQDAADVAVNETNHRQYRSWSGEVFHRGHWPRVSRVYNSDDNGIKNDYPYLLVPSIEDRGGAAFLRGIEDDEVSLLSVAPKLPNSPVAG